MREHLLNELDYLMQQQRWREADLKNWDFIFYSTGRERKGLSLTDIKNFNCKDLKQLNTLWVKNSQVNSQGHFGFSIQKEIFLASGNSLDFDWEKGKWKNLNRKGYNDFAKRVGWKGEDGEWKRYEELPMNLEPKRGEVSKRGELPGGRDWRYDARRIDEGDSSSWLVMILLLSSCRDL